MSHGARQGVMSIRLGGVLVACALAVSPLVNTAAAQMIWVSGDPPVMALQTGALGTGTLQDQSTTYSIFNYSGGKRKITAQIDAAMPTGVTLKVTLDKPGGASGSTVTLDTTPRDAVTNIPSGNFSSGKKFTYELSANATAGTVSRQSRTVTYTIVAQP